MAKGDSISVTYRTGTGVITHTTIATKGGRTVDYEFVKDGGVPWLVVTEKTRSGTEIRTNRYVATEVVAVTSEPEDEP
jgi:hypothetical protein